MVTVTCPNFIIEFDGPPKHDYYIDGKKVPSLTDVIKKVLDKPGLPFWGMKVGVQGVCRLVEQGTLKELHQLDGGPWWRSPQAVVDLLTKNKLTVNHIRDVAAERGKAVHVAARQLAEKEISPDPSKFSEEDRGYIKALLSWWSEFSPDVLGVEEIVGSKHLGYGGTLDLRCQLNWKQIEAATGIVDWKTTSDFRHPAHDYQLAGYELASQESGFPPTDFQAICLLKPGGDWEWYETRTKPEEVAPLIAVYKEQERIKEMLKEQKKAAKQHATA